MAIRRPTLRLLRQLLVTVGAEADAATAAITTSWVKAWDTLAPAWKQAISDAVAYANRTGQWPAPWELRRIEKLRDALVATQEALAKLGEQAGIRITDDLGRIVHVTGDLEPRIIASQLPAGEQAAAVVRFAGRIGPSALDAIVARVSGQVTSQTRPLGARAFQALSSALVRGIAVGDNPLVVARDMVARVQGAFNGGLIRATVIARTEMLDAYRAASAYSHVANADVLRGWQWSSTLDRRTCPGCWAMHGRVFPLDQAGPWDHQQGRCARLPVTRTWAELGYRIPEPGNLVPDARSRFMRLPRATQDEIMGASRAQLLRSGQIAWDDLATLRQNPGWRPSYVPTPIRDLPRQPGFPGSRS